MHIATSIGSSTTAVLRTWTVLPSLHMLLHAAIHVCDIDNGHLVAVSVLHYSQASCRVSDDKFTHFD